MLECKLVIYTKSRRGPNTRPLEAPDSTAMKQDPVSLQKTNCDRLARNEVIHFRTEEEMLNLSSLEVKNLRCTLSKAFGCPETGVSLETIQE